jgi:hypothetical protein
VSGRHYLVRAHVALPIRKPADFPQAVLDTLFWALWAGSPGEEGFCESILFVGPTSYKSLALEYLMPKSTAVCDMTRDTQISELIGSTVLTTAAKIRDEADSLRRAVDDIITERTCMSFDIRRSRIGTMMDRVETGVLQGWWYDGK